jgi:hypothetical protein
MGQFCHLVWKAEPVGYGGRQSAVGAFFSGVLRPPTHLSPPYWLTAQLKLSLA